MALLSKYQSLFQPAEQVLFWKAEARHIREIKQRRFGDTHVNREGSLFLLIYLDATKFVLLKVFSLLETIFLEFEQNHCPIMPKFNLRLTRVAQKRLCLRSLTGLSRSHTRLKIFFSRKTFAKNHTLSSWCPIFNSSSRLCNILFLLISKFFVHVCHGKIH